MAKLFTWADIELHQACSPPSFIRYCAVGFHLFLLPIKTTVLQILQNKAIRIISICNRRTSITPFYHKLGILKIPELYKFEIAKPYQHSKQNLPPTISNLFKPLSNIHNRITRSVSLNHIYVEKFSTLRCQRLIKYQGAKIWNAIPLELRDQSCRNFKLNYKKFCLKGIKYVLNDTYVIFHFFFSTFMLLFIYP